MKNQNVKTIHNNTYNKLITNIIIKRTSTYFVASSFKVSTDSTNGALDFQFACPSP
jgi:hypothetical protein